MCLFVLCWCVSFTLIGNGCFKLIAFDTVGVYLGVFFTFVWTPGVAM